MNWKYAVSEEQLSAFIDNALDEAERLQVLEMIRKDEELARYVSELQQDNELLKLVYRDPPFPRRRRPLVATMGTRYFAVAATVLLTVGVSAMLGYYLSTSNPPTVAFENLAALKPGELPNRRILIHINAMDERRIEAALDKTSAILQAAAQKSEKPQIEIVANADGLGLLRDRSPYAGKIRDLAANHDNVRFLACGIAMEATRLKEGQQVQLLPEAARVPAALEQILLRLKEGWTYVRG